MPIPQTSGPYRVDRVDSPDGPSWRLSGPGLPDTKSYPGDEFREKLLEMAELMNFAWNQSQSRESAPGRPADA